MIQDESLYQYFEEVLKYPRKIMHGFEILDDEIIRVSLGISGSNVGGYSNHPYDKYGEWIINKRNE